MLLIVLGASSAWAQRVSPENTHARILASVPRAGLGTKADPFRPKNLDHPALKALAYSCIVSADRSRFFCEVVASRRADLAPLLNDTAVRWWDKATTPRADLERELRTLQPAASLSRLNVRLP